MSGMSGEPRFKRGMLRFQHGLFLLVVLLVAGLLAWQTDQHAVESDWTGGARHSLSPASVGILEKMDGPIRVEAFARTDKVLRTRITDLVERYRRVYAEISLEFVNPDLEPDRTRDLGVTVDGELVVSYGGRLENLDKLDEQSMTNLLNRLARGQSRVVGFLTGHGERDPRGRANHDLGEFGQQLQLKGFTPEPVNLAAGDLIDDLRVLVVADPRVSLLPEEQEILQGYLDAGGNLLWMREGNARISLPMLEESLGVTLLDGVVVDSNTQLFGIKDPTFALVSSYEDDIELTRGLETITVYPRSGALSLHESDWAPLPFLRTRDEAWNETGPLRGSVAFDADKGEQRGPLVLGVSLTKARATDDPLAGNQRVIVLADSDFLSNAYLGNGGNLDLGLRIFNWLSHDDRLIAVPAKTAPDVSLELGPVSQSVIGFGFLLVLPLGLLLGGFLVWRQRQRLS